MIGACHPVALVVGILALGLTLSGQDNAPSFRPTAGVIQDNRNLPETWSSTENVAWKSEVPGLGWGSPIVWGNTIFVTSVIGKQTAPKPGLDLLEEGKGASYKGGMRTDPEGTYRWMLYAYDLKTGSLRWARQLHEGVPTGPRHPKNTYASETPVTDGERVYVFIGNAGKLVATDFTGKIVWSTAFAMPAPKADEVTSSNQVLDGRQGTTRTTVDASFLLGMGAAASPAIHQGRIYLVDDHEARQWMLAAYDARTGKEIWRAYRPKQEQSYGWSTPFVWENPLRTEIVVGGDLSTRSYDLNGKLLWEIQRMSVNTTPTPLAAQGLLFVQSGYPGDDYRPTYAIRPGASGNISLKSGETSNAYVAWHSPVLASYMTSALAYGDYYYTLITQGFMVCHEAKTGRPVSGRRRIDADSSGFTASPWAYNGKIFALSEDGDTYVIQAGPEYKLLGKNSLNEMALATPAIVRDSVIIRTVGHLFRIAKTHQGPD